MKKNNQTSITFPPLPMLAKDYMDHPLTSAAATHKKAKKPDHRVLQPKLDGVRLVAWWDAESQKVKLTSRTGKPMDHLYDEFGPSILRVFASINDGDYQAARRAGGKLVALDGELYVDDVKTGFQQIVSMVRNTQNTKEIKEGRITLKYFVYDAMFAQHEALSYADRYAILSSAILSSAIINTGRKEEEEEKSRVRLLKNISESATTAEEVEAALESCIAQGYEGVMIRDASSRYEMGGKRSSSLLKYKRFVDSEYPIVGFKEATGKDAGTVLWECSTVDDRKRFNVRPTGTQTERRELLVKARSDPERYTSGKTMLTVRYQELTDCGIPRFPVGVAVRDYE